MASCISVASTSPALATAASNEVWNAALQASPAALTAAFLAVSISPRIFVS